MKFIRVVCLIKIAISVGLVFLTQMPAAGLSVRFVAPVANDSGPEPTSVAVADLNGDGKPDLIVANYCQNPGPDSCTGNSQVAVLFGNGDGTFQPPVIYSTGAYWARSVAVGDVNGDKVPDLVVANDCRYNACQPGNGAVSVLLGNGDGTFQLASVYGSGGYNALSVTLAELRSKGKVDIVVTNTDGGGVCEGFVGVLLGNGDGTFQPAVTYGSGGCIAASVAVGDMNRDGIPDLIVANFCKYNECATTDGQVGVLLGNGDGTFKPALTYYSGGAFFYSLAVGDLRGNGILDVVTANRFSEVGKPLPSTVGVVLGNGDGTLQPAVSYRAHGAGYPSYPAIGDGINSLAIADVNGDGIPDVVAAEWCQNIVYRHGLVCIGTGELSVFLGNGDGSFQKPVAYSTGGYIGSALAIADVNGDGRPDIVVTNACGNNCSGTEGSVAVLLNKTSYHTKTALISSANPARVGQTVTFTATISSTPAVPNGEVVTFYNGKTKLGAGSTANGVASLNTSFSKAKTYMIKASYPGDAFRKKSAGSVKQVVNP